MSDFVLEPVSRIEVGSAGYEHYFGGANRYEGMTPFRDAPPLHLLYDLDANDPLMPVRIPGISRLPLCFGFAYNASAVAYRMESDLAVKLLYVEDTSCLDGYPYDPYPSQFEQVKVRLYPLSYEQHKLLVYYMSLADSSSEELLSDEDATWLQQVHYPFTQLGGVHRMWQGVPHATCHNQECDNYDLSCGLKVFAVVWNNPVPGVALWDPDVEDGGDSQIIYQICPDCHTIHASNRCT